MKTTFAWCLIAAFAANSNASTPVLDQSYENYGGWAAVGSGWRQAQTFVVAQSGKLVRAEVALRPATIQDPTPTIEAQLAVVRTHNHIPRALPEDVLSFASASFPDASFETVNGYPISFGRPFLWVPFDLPPIDVMAGDELAIVLSSPSLIWHDWAADFPGSYPDGQGYWGPPSDLTPLDNPGIPRADYLFRTFVIPVPEPRTTVLASVVAIVALGLTKRRTRPTFRS